MAGKDDYLSASRIAKELGVTSKYVSGLLERAQWIVREDGHYSITADGEKVGAKYMDSPKFGRWIAWPADLLDEIKGHVDKLEVTEKSAKKGKETLLTATALGKQFGISATRINHILSELGWTNKGVKGWQIMKSGEAVGGIQKEDYRSGVPYVVWPEAILENKALISTMAEQGGSSSKEKKEDTKPSESSDDFRKKFEAKHRATDGHYVRSRAEMLIDNWLYMAEIVHAYERKLPIEEDLYSDFYIPAGKIYIEFWGLENEPRYEARKKVKQDLYAKYGFNLIDLNDKDVLNLDDILPRQLLKYGVQAY